MLRRLLSRYTGQEALSIHFHYGKYGKPYLGDINNGKNYAFNCSHSKDIVILAFSASVSLGVDCENMMRELDFTGITKRFFSQSEISTLLSLPEDSRKEAFFNCWTRKEAFIKAKGMGLSIGLDQFDVSLRPDESAKLFRTRYDEKDAQEWSLYDLKISPGFKAALATKSKRFKLTYFDWVP